MARMIPNTISPSTASGAERLMFDQLRNQLPGEFVVLHSVGWTRRKRNAPDADGEADFVILHPNLGLLVLEVKGGRIAVDGSTGVWISTDRGGTRHRITNPFVQAQRNMHSLNNLLLESQTTVDVVSYYTYGVAFPDVRVDDQGFGIGVNRSMWLDSTSLGDLERAVRGIYGAPGTSRKLSDQVIASIVDLIRPTREITRVGLMAEMHYGEASVTELTERQYNLLVFLQNHPRARIAGCAGSGKTMLAVEKARRLALQGFDVLLTCYNKALSGWLREQIAIDPRPELERVHVQHYHDLAMTMCDAAGMPQRVPAGDDAVTFWATGLPDAFMDAIIAMPDRRYDAIIVDEGQDFAAEWWITLQELLRDPQHGVLYIFHDDNQRIYARIGDMPVAAAPYSLDCNCRNTKHIHRAVMSYYHDAPKPSAAGPDGRELQFMPIDRDDTNSVRKVVSELVDREGIAPHQIVVLTPRSQARSSLTDGAKIGNRRLTWSSDTDAHSVRVSTIHAFKGLERDVVIIAETADLSRNAWQLEMLCYVALSRAKHHVIVLGNLPEPVAI